MSTRAELVDLLNEKVITGGRQTTAQKVRDFENDFITSVPNIEDDKDQADGYLGLDADSLVDVIHIAKLTPTGQFLRDDGSWQNVAGSGIDVEQDFGLSSGPTLTLSNEPTFIYGIFKNGVRLTGGGIDYTQIGQDLSFIEELDNDYVTAVYKY